MRMSTLIKDKREYTRFKTDFMKQVLPELASTGAVSYELRSCLGRRL